MGYVSYGLGPTYLSLNAVPGGEVGSRKQRRANCVQKRSHGPKSRDDSFGTCSSYARSSRILYFFPSINLDQPFMVLVLFLTYQLSCGMRYLILSVPLSLLSYIIMVLEAS